MASWATSVWPGAFHTLRSHLRIVIGHAWHYHQKIRNICQLYASCSTLAMMSIRPPNYPITKISEEVMNNHKAAIYGAAWINCGRQWRWEEERGGRRELFMDCAMSFAASFSRECCEFRSAASRVRRSLLVGLPLHAATIQSNPQANHTCYMSNSII
jgi:hypothetical protein